MSTKKLVIFIIIPLILMNIGAGFFIAWNKTSFFSSQAEKDKNPGSEKEAENNIENIIRPVYSLDTFIVNLAERGGKRYLRVKMDLELTNEALAEEIEKRLSQIMDRILMILPTKRFEDINNVEGKIALRDELMTNLNTILKDGKLTNIYFIEFVVQ